jgi:hypothetical protein
MNGYISMGFYGGNPLRGISLLKLAVRPYHFGLHTRKVEVNLADFFRDSGNHEVAEIISEIAWQRMTYSRRVRLLSELKDARDAEQVLLIVQRFNESLNSDPAQKREDQSYRQKLRRAYAGQDIINGVVKILFAPTKINLSSLHPTPVTA